MQNRNAIAPYKRGLQMPQAAYQSKGERGHPPLTISSRQERMVKGDWS
jgi:hypothetical protein